MKWLFLTAAFVGTVLPLRFFIAFLAANGLDLSAFSEHLFQTDVSAFFAMDVVVSAVVLWLFVFVEGRRRGMNNLWIYLLSTVVVGVSLALPLFLFFRELRLKDTAR